MRTRALELLTDKEIKEIVGLCQKFTDLEIDACCENNRYIVNAKSLGAMRLMKDGGEVYFRPFGDNQESIDRFVKSLVEYSANEKKD